MIQRFCCFISSLVRDFVYYAHCDFSKSTCPIFITFGTDVQHSCYFHNSEVKIKVQGQNHSTENLTLVIAWPWFIHPSI